MMSLVRPIAAVMLVCAITTVASAFDPMTATIRVSNGSLYDYVIIGEHTKATDGFDNAYDTISPGNLNATMGQPYISAIILQPAWKPAMQELRGDFRSLAKHQEWNLTVTSSLPQGTPLTIALQPDEGSLPKEMKLLLKDEKAGKERNLRAGNCVVPAPGMETPYKLIVIAEQP